MPPPTVTLNVGGEPFKGSASARVAILEYSDFDCSYCATYAREIYPLIDHTYIQAGTVKYFFRDLPGPEHPNAPFKARLARCAGDQGRFWEAHDRLFRDQKPIDGAGLTQFTRDLGLDEAALRSCISSDSYLDAIQRSTRLAQGMRINGTPAFLIGTMSDDGTVMRAAKVFLGAESFQAFRTVLDDLLKPAKK
jgi:protein-disulfide isomerase